MKSFVALLLISLLSLIAPSVSSPVSNPNTWTEQPKDLTDLSQFPPSFFQTTASPVPASIVKAYNLDFTPSNTTGTSIIAAGGVQASWTTKCETTEGSPVAWHTDVAVNWLRARGETQCIQWQNPGCTRLIGFLSSNIAVCGEYHYWLWCDSAAGFTRSVFDQCRNWLGGDDRAGGFTVIQGWPGSGDFRGMMVY
ncbi:hypothetical protein L873DRAFT_1842113 [Choiromyces venosus 120613-1]|uniref:Ecp2 effector protein domain-containing protein n=1 Tax=Choiromyces venosus 120613-1 TaxID=1336337 RepID=A0A3N4JUD7_9PEZI|nr:hypothetical protein L873DRAFT_1842113 [Choiromyces venosus 120613-1]